VLLLTCVFVLPALTIVRAMILLNIRQKAIQALGAICWLAFVGYYVWVHYESTFINALTETVMPAGLVLISTLSGYGSINCPITYWNVYFKDIDTVRAKKQELYQRIQLTLDYL
jgi:hypothetical protein